MASTRKAVWTWRFDAPPEKVWPAMADTARFNEAAATPKYRVEATPQQDGTVIYTGAAKIGPFDLAWRDLPQEWIVGRYFRHRREFTSGPFRSMLAVFRLEKDGPAASRGEFTLEFEPANLLGRLLLAGGVFRATGKTFARLFAEAGAYAAGRRDEPFQPPVVTLTDEAKPRLAAIRAELIRQGAAPDHVDRLIRLVAEASELDLQHIRPLRLAARWGADERAVIELC